MTDTAMLDTGHLLVLTDCPTLLHGEAGERVSGTYRVEGWVTTGFTPDYFHLRPALGGARVGVKPEWLIERSQPAPPAIRAEVIADRLHDLGYEGEVLLHEDGRVQITLSDERKIEYLIDSLERRG